MSFLLKPLRVWLKVGFIGWFAITQMLVSMPAAFAQANPIDVEPPLIEHDIITDVDAASRQSFFATVVDDDELDSVSLFYRFSGESTYSVVLMNRVSFSSTYIAHIPTSADNDQNIEYYIQARDKAGNRTVRGYAFNPLVRVINKQTSVADASTVQPSSEVASSSGSGKNRTILYVVLGALAVGLIAGAAGASGGSGGGGEACPDGMCTISITVGQP